MPNSPQTPRCAALVGAYTSGKTTLLEEMLFAAGATERRGTINEGNTVGDAAPEARARKMSTELSAANLAYLGEAWTLIDCPGSVELSYESECAMMVADIVVVVCEPLPEKAATVSRLLRFLDDRAIPHLIFINKMDLAQASVRKTLEALQGFSARPLVLREIPLRDDQGKVTGFVDLVSERAWRWNPHKQSDLISLPDPARDDQKSARDMMLERLADYDDALMEELLEDIVPSTSEIYQTLTRDLAQDLVVPVFFGSAEGGNGIQRLFKALRHEAPSVAATAERLAIDATGNLVQVFKTLYAGQSGKMSLARVWSGEVKDGMTLGSDRVGGVMSVMGRKTSAKGAAKAGDVVALGRMANAATGVLLAPDKVVEADWPAPPPPLFSFAIHAERQADEVKLIAALARMAEEDPALHAGHNGATGELVIEGQGEIHLQIALSRLRGEAGLAVAHDRPALPFKETITKPASQHSRHKKQSGGHGEFADVHLEIKPQPRGAGFAFGDRITGGVVPKQYIPAVEKGVQGFLAKGPLGFPIVDIAVTLTDGSFHAVDSSDMAFQKAAQKAMAEALPNCSPVLLEPIQKVTVSIPTEFTPRIQRIVTGRRGQLLGFDAKPGWPGWDEVMALMPQAEMHDLIVDLRSQSLGAGSYEFEFDHLREVSGKEAEQVLGARAAH